MILVRACGSKIKSDWLIQGHHFPAVTTTADWSCSAHLGSIYPPELRNQLQCLELAQQALYH